MVPLILGAISIASSLFGKKKEKKAAKIQRQAVAAENRKARLETVKQYRTARAAVISGAVARGAQDSSAQYGVTSSLGSQVQEELMFSMEQESRGQAANKNLEKANRYAFMADVFSAGANLSGSLPGGGKTNVASGSVGSPPPPPSPTVNSSPFAPPSL
jgi:hypothetical protein